MRYIKKCLCLRLPIVLQEKQNTVHYNYDYPDCNDATTTRVSATGKPYLKSGHSKNDVTTTKGPDLRIDYNHDLYVTLAFHRAIIVLLPFSTLLFNRSYVLGAFWWWCKRVAVEALFQGVITFPGDGGKTQTVITEINNDFLFPRKALKSGQRN